MEQHGPWPTQETVFTIPVQDYPPVKVYLKCAWPMLQEEWHNLMNVLQVCKPGIVSPTVPTAPRSEAQSTGPTPSETGS